MGTPEFAVASLEALLQTEHEILAVVTTPDKPAGRGQKVHQSEVKKYALEHSIPILQPEKLKDPTFIEQLKDLSADLQVVVAFRMLPEVVWNMPTYGTLNLHGSLLPHYRGAAPINWAIMNGEVETGVTTFFIEHSIDTGNIIFQEKIQIEENETAGDIHDKLMVIGAKLVVKTVQAINNKDYPQIPQIKLVNDGAILKSAPKLFKDNCKIDWTKGSKEIYNFIRGLSPYPAAWTIISIPNAALLNIKIFEASFEINVNSNHIPGEIETDEKSYLKVRTADGYINIFSLQLEGKKRLSIDEFLRGFHQIKNCRFCS
jgi:methionyl-tRNA formyltransferase